MKNTTLPYFQGRFMKAPRDRTGSEQHHRRGTRGEGTLGTVSLHLHLESTSKMHQHHMRAMGSTRKNPRAT